MEYTVDESCTSVDAYEVKLKNKMRIDLARVKAAVPKAGGEIVAETPVVLMAKINGKGVSIYASGRILIKDAERNASEEIAKKLGPALEREGALS
ncbi:hypothetical protein H0O02_03270 [Candidatus Micrarchaeota archaeon]|nr:hypothetical protein [Candidatus Micrarchaeota archaeon]